MANKSSSTLAKSFCKCRNNMNKADDTWTYTCCVNETLAKYNLDWSITHRRVCRISVMKSLHQKFIKLSLSVIALMIRCTMIKAYGPHAANPRNLMRCTTVIWVEACVDWPQGQCKDYRFPNSRKLRIPERTRKLMLTRPRSILVAVI
jgi:hypothetical protein